RLLAATADAGRLRAAVEQHAEAAHVAVGPVLGLHLAAGGVDPGDILDAELLAVLAGEEAAAAQDRIAVAQRRELAHEADQAIGALVVAPVDPRDLVVLAIG